MAEATKFCLSLFFHINDFEGLRPSSEGANFNMKFSEAKKVLISNAEPGAIACICTLAFFYLFNNLTNFYLNGPADPGSIFLFKSGSTVITAVMMWRFLNRPVNELQWGAIVMQVAGLVIVQFDPCKGRPVLELYVYGIMGFSTCVTATNAIMNDYMLKNFKLTMHCQNMFLYGAGCIMNVTAFFFLPGWCTHTPPNTGFFDGYDTLPAILVVVFNALIGIAISFVYKYTDAVVKTFASATVTVVLVIFSATYLQKETTLVAWNGVCIVIVATYMYSQAGKLSKKATAPAAVAPAKEAPAKEAPAAAK
jgi:drug/metabolite transporter (DMT)-like permease